MKICIRLDAAEAGDLRYYIKNHPTLTDVRIGRTGDVLCFYFNITKLQIDRIYFSFMLLCCAQSREMVFTILLLYNLNSLTVLNNNVNATLQLVCANTVELIDTVSTLAKLVSIDAVDTSSCLIESYLECDVL